MIKNLLLTMAIVAGTYAAIFIGYLLVPVMIFMFVLFVIQTVGKMVSEDSP